MPTLTLRVTTEEQALLRTLAELRRESVSDVVRRYLKTGIDGDTQGGQLEAQVKQLLDEETERLNSLTKVIHETVNTATPEQAQVGGD